MAQNEDVSLSKRPKQQEAMSGEKERGKRGKKTAGRTEVNNCQEEVTYCCGICQDKGSLCQLLHVALDGMLVYCAAEAYRRGKKCNGWVRSPITK